MSVQKSSVRASVPSAPCGEMRINKDENEPVSRRLQSSIPSAGHMHRPSRRVAGSEIPSFSHLKTASLGRHWGYRKYMPGDTLLKELEHEAREARKGLWADPQPMPPWKCRKLR